MRLGVNRATNDNLRFGADSRPSSSKFACKVTLGGTGEDNLDLPSVGESWPDFSAES
jgi:hypothetical protein